MYHNFVLYQFVSPWLTVLDSLRRNVRTAKSLTAKCPYGEMSYGEISYGEKSYGEKSGHGYTCSGCTSLEPPVWILY